MLDFSPYMQSSWSWIILFVTALLVGMSKTGIQGLTLLTIPLLAMTFGAKPSTGLVLPVLCIRLVKILPERGFSIFTTAVTIISVLVMLLA